MAHKRRKQDDSAQPIAASQDVEDSDNAPCTPQPIGLVPAPTTPPPELAPCRRHSMVVRANPFAYKETAEMSRFSLTFDNVESFMLWIATSSSRHQRNGGGNRTSFSASPGWGTIEQLQITRPQIYSGACIGAVRWLHWGDGTVLVETMTDSNPTRCRPLDQVFSQEAKKQAQIRRSHLKARLQILLALRDWQ